jgi:hypothetical protein
VKDLINKSKYTQSIFSSKNMADKIYMFLGITGQGKSTSILYLAGEIMKVMKVRGLYHIDAVRPLKNP